MALAVGNFDGNGETDLAVAGTDANFSNFVTFLDANGNGAFALQNTIALGDEIPTAITAADLEGPGAADLAITADDGNGDVL